MAHIPDEQRIRTARNTARFFAENPNIAWVVLVATIIWGIFGYWKMPKRKDPIIPFPVAAVVCVWPGIAAEEIEQRVTKKIEAKLAENPNIEKLKSTVRSNVSVTAIVIYDDVKDMDREFDDLKSKLDSINDLPPGAGPIVFLKNFGDTATLMLTMASPRADGIELSLRARSVRSAIEAVRGTAPQAQRSTIVIGFPQSVPTAGLQQLMESLAAWLQESGTATDTRVFGRPGFLGIDLHPDADDAALLAAVARFAGEQLRQPHLHPEFWMPAVIHASDETEAKFTAVAGSRYSLRELDKYSDLLQQILLASPRVGKVTRVGVLPEAVYLGYSQDRLSVHGIALAAVRDALSARNIALPGGITVAQGRNVALSPSGEFGNEKDLSNVMIGASPRGDPVYLRDLFEITRDYQSPPQLLNAFTFRDSHNQWQSTPAVTLAVHMRTGEQVADFGAEIDRLLASGRAALLPADLLVAKTSDQPLQVKESISLFTRSLWEAVVLVVLIAFIGFWQWRSALLIALSIPLTLSMTFGLMHALGIDLQQMSIASLIIALGLLVDDPVVAGDAIQREVSAGRAPRIAAWLGPTKLANAIVFATITNVVAYLPLLFAVHGGVGHFIYSLPVVLTCSLVASRIVSMTFVPLLGMYLLCGNVAQKENRLAQRFFEVYRRVGGWTLDHRRVVLLSALSSLAAGAFLFASLKSSFFPKDLSYLFYVDVWTPEDSPLFKTADAATSAEAIIRDVADDYARKSRRAKDTSHDVLRSMTSFVGGGGPRFWFSIEPELQQLNYAQIVVQTNDKHDTRYLAAALQRAFDRQLVGAYADVRELETGEPVGVPVSVRFSGLEIGQLREIAEQAKTLLRGIPEAERIRDDWGVQTLSIPLRVDPDRANLSGMTNLDVAYSAIAATNGLPVTTLRESDREIPVLLRLQPEKWTGLEGLQNLDVLSTQGARAVPLRQVASLGLEMRPEKIQRRNHFRTVTVGAFPTEGVLPSQVFAKVRPALSSLAHTLPPGYRMEIGGEEEAQVDRFIEVLTAMIASVVLIYLALVVEFRSAVKPLVVFSGIPFGIVGALASLGAVGVPFGFMAFLGIASLMGVIVSHIVVLFDFIEDARERGVPLREALLSAGIVRLRPVLITVGATVLGLIPLACHGGPLWEPLCFAQIGGLTVATVITLLLVPVIYSVFVLDLHLVSWETNDLACNATSAAPSGHAR